jgi:hypothetical protein
MPERQLFDQHWNEFVRQYPFMVEHVHYLSIPNSAEPEMGLDFTATYTFARWCLQQGYGNRAWLEAFVHDIEKMLSEG